jgi:hypothetical protein
MARLNADGSLDAGFVADANDFIVCLTMESDGKVLAGGRFTDVGGQHRDSLVRLAVEGSAPTQSLAVSADGSAVQWLRGGAGPEVDRVTFETSVDGINYFLIGAGTRISGGWQLANLDLPTDRDIFIRARGFFSTRGDASIVESVRNAYVSTLRIDTVSRVAGRTSGGQNVTLTGSFANLSTVTVGGVVASWSYTNGTSQITLTTPPHAAGVVSIDLLPPSSGAGYSKGNAFAYLPTVFTDDTIVPGVTTAKAQHVVELRQAVDALRAVAGLAGAPWTDPALSGGSTIAAVHIVELRSYLEDAAVRLGLGVAAYTDPTLTAGFMIKQVHVEELRQRIRGIAG